MYNSNSFYMQLLVYLSNWVTVTIYFMFLCKSFLFKFLTFLAQKEELIYIRIYVTVIITHAMDAIVDDLPHPHSVALKLVRCSWYSLKWSYLVEI